MSVGDKFLILAQNIPGPGIRRTRTGQKKMKDELGPVSGKGIEDKGVQKKGGNALELKAASGLEPIGRKRKPKDLPQTRLTKKRREGWATYLTEQIAQARANKENNTKNGKNAKSSYLT